LEHAVLKNKIKIRVAFCTRQQMWIPLKGGGQLM
jgi:hypothetical protein